MYIVNFIYLEDELSPLNSLASLSLHAMRNCRCEKRGLKASDNCIVRLFTKLSESRKHTYN